MTAKKGKYAVTRSYRSATHSVSAQPKKRGAKSYYTGSRLAFLEQYCDEYISLRGKCRKLFWHRFFTEWWQKYPWRLQDHEEPPTDDPEKMAELALVGEDKDLKSKVEEKVRKVRLLSQKISARG